MNDCLRRIAGLNSPASPPPKKTDTSYNNHALRKQHGNGQDAGSIHAPRRERRTETRTEPEHDPRPPRGRSAILSKFHF